MKEHLGRSRDEPRDLDRKIFHILQYRKMQSQIGYFINAKLLLCGNQSFFVFFFFQLGRMVFFSVKYLTNVFSEEVLFLA